MDAHRLDRWTSRATIGFLVLAAVLLPLGRASFDSLDALGFATFAVVCLAWFVPVWTSPELRLARGAATALAAVVAFSSVLQLPWIGPGIDALPLVGLADALTRANPLTLYGSFPMVLLGMLVLPVIGWLGDTALLIASLAVLAGLLVVIEGQNRRRPLSSRGRFAGLVSIAFALAAAQAFFSFTLGESHWGSASFEGEVNGLAAGVLGVAAVLLVLWARRRPRNRRA